MDLIDRQAAHKWETCFECPLSHGCPKIKGCTNEQAIEYASQIPNDCPLSAQSEQKTDGDTISRQAAIGVLEKVAELYPWRVPGDRDSYSQYNEAWQDALNRADSEIEALPAAQPQYEELTPEEAASEIASGSTMTAWYWLDDMIRIKQMGYVICRKR